MATNDNNSNISTSSRSVPINPTRLKQKASVCPFASLQTNINDLTQSLPTKCPYHNIHNKQATPSTIDTIVNKILKANIKSGTFITDSISSHVLKDIGGGDVIRQMCTRFYSYAFRDGFISKFFYLSDGAEAHGDRLANWIIQKMGGEGNPWDDSGRAGLRQSSHRKAWNSIYGSEDERGDHFKLDDCRIWMRLMFLSARDLHLHQHQAFWSWYISFISHFISVYEYSAPPFAKIDAEWGANIDNIIQYQNNGYLMLDVIGIKHADENE